MLANTQKPTRLSHNEPDDGEDDFLPPKRKMSINAMSPEVARRDADILRNRLLDPTLSRYEAEQIANELAQDVSTYGCVDQRIEEILASGPIEENNLLDALKFEYDALIRVQQDKKVTEHQIDNLNSTATVLGLMNGGKFGGHTIDLIAYKEAMQKQMDDLVASGAERESRLAQLAIMAQKSAEAILLESIAAPTQEAKAMMIKHGVASLEAAGRRVEKLDAMAAPVGGRIVDHIEDRAPDQPNQLLTGDNNGRRKNSRKLDTPTQKESERVDAQEQTLVTKHRPKIEGGKG